MRMPRSVKKYPYGSTGVLVFVLTATVTPLYWMVASSLKSSPELAKIPVTLWPHALGFTQYSKLFAQSQIVHATLNSLFLALSTTVAVVIFGSCAAYAVTQLRFRARSQLLSVSLITQFLPQAATLLPVFIIWSRLHLVNSLPGVTLLYVAFQLPVSIWLLTGYFASIPQEVVDAAEVDGSGSVHTLVRIVMPMAAPGIAAVAIWCAIGCWSEFLFALILLNGESQSVPVIISGLIGEHSTDLGMLLAGATVATLPPLILFFFVQKYFANGLAGALKG